MPDPHSRLGRRVALDPIVAERLRHLQLTAAEAVDGFLTGRHKSPRRGVSVEFVERRPYVQGDDLRHLDWKAFARTDRLAVKRYEEETSLEATLVVDASHSMAYPESADPRAFSTKYDFACQVAAALSFLVLRERDGAATALFDHTVDRVLTASTSPTHLQSILAALSEREPRGETDFEAVMGRLVNALPRPGIVVLVSDGFGDPENLGRAFGMLRARGHECVFLHVMHHDELTFPFEQLTRFEDLEGDTKLMVDAPALREGYLEALRAWRAEVRRVCQGRGVEYELLDTADPLERVLSAWLGRRMARVGNRR